MGVSWFWKVARHILAGIWNLFKVFDIFGASWPHFAHHNQQNNVGEFAQHEIWGRTVLIEKFYIAIFFILEGGDATLASVGKTGLIEAFSNFVHILGTLRGE